MSKLIRMILVAITCGVTPAIAGVTVEVIPAFGPDLKGPSYIDFFANAMSELRAPGSTVATRADDATGYELVPADQQPYREVLSSRGFRSWRGKADPTLGWDDGKHTPGAFSSEFGTQIYFGARITVDDPLNDDIRLADLRGEIHWEDYGIGPSSVLTGSLSVNFSGEFYDKAIVGVDFGSDGVPGGADDTVYDQTVGDLASPCGRHPCNTVPVDAIYLVGLADSIWVDSFGPGLSPQENLDEAVRLLDALPTQSLRASYTIASVGAPAISTTGTGEVLFSYSPGDYDRDGDVDLKDYAVWTDEYGLTARWRADGNNDGRVDAADFAVWRDDYVVPSPGDYDRDGDVDLDDYAVWTDEYGLTGDWNADGNQDGRVDTGDFNVWRDNYAALPLSHSVPEPHGLLLALLAGGGGAVGRCFGRSVFR